MSIIIESTTENELVHKIVNSVIERLQGIKTKEETTEAQEEYLTRAEVGKMFNVSKTTIDFWKKKGLLSFAKVGRRVLFKKAELVELINNNTIKRGMK